MEDTVLRPKPLGIFVPRILVIGCSTGGTEALLQLLPLLNGVDGIPILIAQHMAESMMANLPEMYSKAVGRAVVTPDDQQEIKPGGIYLAPGGLHLEIKGPSVAPTIHLSDGPPINFCRPAVDPLFQSAAKVYGKNVLGLILTGMGEDGVAGAKDVVESSGIIACQDKATSVVWGMPGATVHAGLAHSIGNLEELGMLVNELTLLS